jgi:hypothetical protein
MQCSQTRGEQKVMRQHLRRQAGRIDGFEELNRSPIDPRSRVSDLQPPARKAVLEIAIVLKVPEQLAYKAVGVDDLNFCSTFSALRPQLPRPRRKPCVVPYGVQK